MSNPSSKTVARLARPLPHDGPSPVKDWSWAQDRANFVLVGPGKSSGWTIRDATLRGESPQHHSTLRYFLEDGNGARLRVKQYFNDWWIPTVPDISFRKPGRPLVFGDQVAFVGRDYRRNPALCGHRFGTAIEFSVEERGANENAWVEFEAGDADHPVWTGGFWNDLTPLDPPAAIEARKVTYAARNYWNRWGRTAAPWDSTEICSLRWEEPNTALLHRAAWAVAADSWAAVPGTIDSLGTRTGPFGDEVQGVFRDPMTLNCSAWMRVLRRPPGPWRPLLDASEVNRPSWEKRTLGGRPLERATMDPAVGNWFYAWRQGDRTYEVHLRARAGLTGDRADAMMSTFLDGLD